MVYGVMRKEPRQAEDNVFLQISQINEVVNKASSEYYNEFLEFEKKIVRGAVGLETVDLLLKLPPFIFKLKGRNL